MIVSRRDGEGIRIVLSNQRHCIDGGDAWCLLASPSSFSSTRLSLRRAFVTNEKCKLDIITRNISPSCAARMQNVFTTNG